MEEHFYDNEMDLLLYQYSQKNGGYFIGDSEHGNYPDCQLVLDQAEQPIVLSSIVTSRGQYGYGFRFVGRMQVELPYPLELSLLPMNLLRKGLKLVTEGTFNVKVPEFDKKYLIKSNSPDFIKMFLPGSGMAELLRSQKHIGVMISPIHKGDPIHTIKVFCNKGVWGESIYAGPIEAKDIECVAELCRETYQAVRRYPMPEPEKKTMRMD